MEANLRQEVLEIVNQLPKDADWDDLLFALYAEGKVSLGLSEVELDEPMTREKFDQLFTRAESAHDLPDDMRNTQIYHPGNMTTLGIGAGVISAVFAFVFPPLSFLAAPVAFIAGVFGVMNHQPKAWIAILLAAVTVVPFIPMLLK
jgi:hypothetical protein